MANRHHRTMEAGGWLLLFAALGWLAYFLFNRKGQSAATGGTVVSATLGGIPVGPPVVTPNDPSAVSTYKDGSGTLYVWSTTGQQWHPSATQINDNLPAKYYV